MLSMLSDEQTEGQGGEAEVMRWGPQAYCGP